MNNPEHDEHISDIDFELSFMHPQYGTTLNVIIPGDRSIEEMIQKLLINRFIQPHDPGYDLSFNGRILEPSLRFEEVEDLYDSALIGVVARTENVEPIVVQETKKILHLKIQHPTNGHFLDFRAEEDTKIQDILTNLYQRGYFYGELTAFSMSYKDTNHLSLEHTLAELGIVNLDVLRIVDDKKNEQPTWKDELEGLKNQLAVTSAQLEEKIKDVRENMPAPDLIPVDEKLSVNPTITAYESMESILSEIRAKDGFAPFIKIKTFSWIPILIITLLIILVVVAILVPQFI
ncbi:MAG: hypothetical protein MK212_10540 [Saprospiraceae bacterium]|nr:hypothetical protein [Saprospiraceae bacterium]